MCETHTLQSENRHTQKARATCLQRMAENCYPNLEAGEGITDPALLSKSATGMN